MITPHRPVSRKISVYVEHQPQVHLEETVVQVFRSPENFWKNDSRSQVYDNESYVWWCTYLSKPWHMGISKAQNHQTAAHLIVVCH